MKFNDYLKSVENLTTEQLSDKLNKQDSETIRKIIYEWDKMLSGKGRSTETRSFGKDAQIFMLTYSISLDTMFAVKEMVQDKSKKAEFIRSSSGDLIESADEFIKEKLESQLKWYSHNPKERSKGESWEEYNKRILEKTRDVLTVETPNEESEKKIKEDPDPATSDLQFHQKANTSSNSNGDLESMFTNMIMENINLKDVLDINMFRDSVSKEIEDKIKEHKQIHLEVITSDGDKKDVGTQHKNFELLLKLVRSRSNIMLVGPTGSGKTYGCESVADALDLDFRTISVGLETSKVDLLGYMNGHGNYVSTGFRECYQNGGVFLIDEIDAGNPNVMTVLNAATANNACDFPDKRVEQHEDNIIIAAANTYGSGADRQYVGRNQLDAATLDRFAVLEWDYDLELERQLSGNSDWVEKIQQIRKICREKNIRHIVSPRASISGSNMLSMGIPKDKCMEMLVWKGLDKASAKSIKSEMSL